MQSLQRQLDTSANAAFQKVSSISGKVRHDINMNFFSGLSNVLKSNKYQNAIGNIENANRKIRNKITQNKCEKLVNKVCFSLVKSYDYMV